MASLLAPFRPDDRGRLNIGSTNGGDAYTKHAAPGPPGRRFSAVASHSCPVFNADSGGGRKSMIMIWTMTKRKIKITGGWPGLESSEAPAWLAGASEDSSPGHPF